MKNRSSKKEKRKLNSPFLTEEEQAAEAYYCEEMRQEEAFVKEVKALTKAQLIELLLASRSEADEYSGWVISKNLLIARLRRKKEEEVGASKVHF